MEELITDPKKIYEILRSYPDLKEVSDEELWFGSKIMAKHNADPYSEWVHII